MKLADVDAKRLKSAGTMSQTICGRKEGRKGGQRRKKQKEEGPGPEGSL